MHQSRLSHEADRKVVRLVRDLRERERRPALEHLQNSQAIDESLGVTTQLALLLPILEEELRGKILLRDPRRKGDLLAHSVCVGLRRRQPVDLAGSLGGPLYVVSGDAG